MKNTMHRSSFAPIVLLLLASVTLAQADARLVGTWVGADEFTEGEKLTFHGDGTCDLDGDALLWSVPGPGTLRLTLEGESHDSRYEFDGDTLVLVDEGDRMRYRRTSPAPGPAPAGGPEPGANPLGGPAAGNPLGGPPASPFARAFEGENIALRLQQDGGGVFRGTLRFQGQDFPVQARAAGNELSGTFESQGKAFPFTAVLSGDDLKLESGGRTYELRGEKQAPAHPPQGGGMGAAAGSGPPPLTGVDTGAGSRFEHPRGFYSFEMPSGWSVWQQTDDALTLNPGLKETDSLDAIIVVGHGRLEPAERNRDLLELIAGGESELRQSLQQQGLQLGAVKEAAHKVTVGEIPGAVCSWRASAASGQALEIWFGGLVVRDYYLSVLAIIVEGKQDRFLPKAKRVFKTMRPRPPQANPQLEQALVGRRFFSGSSSDGNSFHASYDFGAGNQVLKKMMFSGRADVDGVGVGGSSEEPGRYEVVGDEVYMYFRDGQESAQVLTGGGQVTGLKFGDQVYKPR